VRAAADFATDAGGVGGEAGARGADRPAPADSGGGGGADPAGAGRGPDAGGDRGRVERGSGADGAGWGPVVSGDSAGRAPAAGDASALNSATLDLERRDVAGTPYPPYVLGLEDRRRWNYCVLIARGI